MKKKSCQKNSNVGGITELFCLNWGQFNTVKNRQRAKEPVLKNLQDIPQKVIFKDLILHPGGVKLTFGI